MSTSPLEGIATLAPSLYGDGEAPLDAVTTRDGIANTLLHGADSFAQVRVNFVAIAEARATAAHSSFATVDASPITDQWYRIGGVTGTEWPLTLRSDGSGYRLRVRLAGSAGSAGGATVRFRLVICPSSTAAAERDRAVDYVWESGDVTSGTAAWLTGSTNGAASSATVIVVSEAEARAWTRPVSVPDAVSSGSPATTQQCLVAAHVFARTSNTGILPRLHALHVAEYVGL